MTTLYLIRHGTNDFTGKRLVGRTPGIHLNAEGVKQAEAVCQALEGRHISAIFSSPLERALETAAPLSQAIQLPVQVHSGLQEVDFGAWQGFTTRKMHRLTLFKLTQESPSLVRFPGGESYAEAQQRVVDALREIAATEDNSTAIACFSHCDVIRLAIAAMIGLPLDAFQSLSADPGSISVLHLHQQKSFLVKLNCRPAEL
jgi:probable phosphoglycerate mutase